MRTPVDNDPLNPNTVLLGAQAGMVQMPVCDHYSGVEVRMRKTLQLQAEMTEEFGTCVFDATLDCEDGAPVGGEHEHALLVSELAAGAAPSARVAVRVHPVDHPSFADDIATIVPRVGQRLAHLMVPKVESVADIHAAVAAVDAAGAPGLALHALIESPKAVHNAFDIAAHPRVASLSFGVMDFVSAHAGAIPSVGMGIAGQFSHPLVVRAKLDISSACHAHGKVPSHCVVPELNDLAAFAHAAQRAAQELGCTRMWSIHPSQIRPILQAMSPSEADIDTGVQIIEKALAAQWAPIRHDGQLHDRASYRFFWQVLQRAHATGRAMPESLSRYLVAPSA
jgi:citrate lyase subunit beta/citryl-CoA lyase